MTKKLISVCLAICLTLVLILPCYAFDYNQTPYVSTINYSEYTIPSGYGICQSSTDEAILWGGCTFIPLRYIDNRYSFAIAVYDTNTKEFMSVWEQQAYNRYINDITVDNQNHTFTFYGQQGQTVIDFGSMSCLTLTRFILESPSEGQEMNGIVSIRGYLEDVDGIYQVYYYLDGNLIATGGYTSSTGEIRAQFHSGYYSAGEHVLTITALTNSAVTLNLASRHLIKY